MNQRPDGTIENSYEKNLFRKITDGLFNIM